ncbi:hypothetical protein D3C87_1104250 [compost metagenome]
MGEGCNLNGKRLSVVGFGDGGFPAAPGLLAAPGVLAGLAHDHGPVGLSVALPFEAAVLPIFLNAGTYVYRQLSEA